jgi:hypothetical protein
MSKIDTFNIGPQQQPQNFYLLNDANNNFVFECTTFDVSTNLTVTPSFVDYNGIAGRGFNGIDETATLNVSNASLNNLFVFQPKQFPTISVNDLLDENNEMFYGVNEEVFKFNYSDAIVSKTNGNIPLYQDYINSLAQKIIGGPYNINQQIIKNTTQLYDGIRTLNATFNIAFNLAIQNHRDPSLNDPVPRLSPASYNDENYPFSKSCQQLVYGILSLSNTNIVSNRITQFFEDISAQQNVPNPNQYYYVKFHPGDVFAIKITYQPNIIMKNVSASNMAYPFTDRSYKIFLKVV